MASPPTTICHLPVEILTDVIQRIIPRRWHVDSRLREETLRLRLVCHQFDDLVSHVAFTVLRVQSLLLMPVPTKRHTIKWLLFTRVGLSKANSDKAIQFIRDAVSVLSTEAAWNTGNTGSRRDYLDAACSTIIAHRGASWSLTTLVCSFRRLTGPPPIDFTRLQINGSDPFTGSRDDRWVRQAQGILQIASSHGNMKVVEKLLALGLDPNYCHELFGYALCGAVNGGHVDVARLLLSYGARTDVKGDLGGLLEVAAQKNHGAVLECLLETDIGANLEYVTHCLCMACKGGYKGAVTVILRHPGVDVNAEDDVQRTPLLYAGEFGQKGVARLLLNHAEIDPNARSFLGHTVLVWAARQGWVDVVQDLLAREDVNPDPSPGWNESPLEAALYCGHEDIARIFIARNDIRPIFRNRSYCPLWLAIKANNAELVGLLLDRYKLDPNKIVRHDLTSLGAAVALNKISVVQMLLQREDVDPNHRVKDKNPTPLAMAVRRGHTEIVKLLITREDLCPNIMTSWYTPLEQAVLKGYQDIVQLLLSRPDTRLDLHGHTLSPLSAAVSKHRLDIMRMLLSRPDIDPNQCTRRSAPALYYAILAGENRLVEELLRRTDINPNRGPILPPPDPGFPLGYAVKLGRIAMVRQLLARWDIDVNMSGTEGTALGIAIKHGCRDMLELLLERPDINVNLKSEPYRNFVIHHRLNNDPSLPTYSAALCKAPKGGEPPLVAAAKRGLGEFLSILLEDSRTNKDVADVWKRTPLWWASYGSHPDIVKILLSHGAYHTNLPDIQGWTPLMVAVNHRRRPAISLLLEDLRLNPNIANVDGWTALHLAANAGDFHTVSKLLKHPKVEWDNPLPDGQTPLMLAEERGHELVASAIRKRMEIAYTDNNGAYV